MAEPAVETRREAIARRVIDVHGQWVVSHPFTGRSEYTTGDRSLAEHVAAEFDRHDPVTIAWLYEEFAKLPGRVRNMSEWVMPLEFQLMLRRLAQLDGPTLWYAPVGSEVPDVLLGLPIAIDEDAVGIHLRPIT